MADELPLIGSGIDHQLLIVKSETNAGGPKGEVAAAASSQVDALLDFRVKKVKVTASLAGFSDIEVKFVSSSELTALAPMARGLAMKVVYPNQPAAAGIITQSNAIIRYLANAYPEAELYGRTDFDQSQVDQWLESSWNEYETPLLAISTTSSADTQGQNVISACKHYIMEWFKVLDSALERRTFLVGHRLTVADIALCCSYEPCLGAAGSAHSSSCKQQKLLCLSQAELAIIPHVLRWYHTVMYFIERPPTASGCGGGGAKKVSVPSKASSSSSSSSTKTASLSPPSSSSKSSGKSSPRPPPPPPAGGPSHCMTSDALVKEFAQPSLPSPKFSRSRIRVKELLEKGTAAVGQEVVVKGWLRTSRQADGGKLLFLVISDGSCAGTIQAVAFRDKTEGFEEADGCGGAGACISVKGRVVESQGKGQGVEIQTELVEVLGPVYESDGVTISGKNYPLAKKHHSIEFLRSIGHLRPRSRLGSSIMRVRHAMAYATHKFFNDRGFLYVHTPLITGADCEGAGEQFVVTTTLEENGKIDPKALKKDGKTIDFSKDFFGKRTCLTVSGQLNVETHCCSLGDVYTFGPTFRAEHSITSRHLAEFWMIEPEIAFADLKDDMNLAEDYIKYLTAYAMEHCQDDLEFFESFPSGEKGLRERLRNVLHNDFIRLTYTKAVELLQQHVASKKVMFERYPEWGEDLGSEHEKFITEHVYKQPVVVTDYPKGIKAFYMKLNPDQKTVAAMDVLVPKIGEIIGGSQREEHLSILEERAAEMGLPVEAINWYCDLRRYGTMKHAGFGLGFERLIMFVTGIENIKDVIPFPRSYGASCEY